jgi:hypothetical protein
VFFGGKVPVSQVLRSATRQTPSKISKIKTQMFFHGYSTRKGDKCDAQGGFCAEDELVAGYRFRTQARLESALQSKITAKLFINPPVTR